MKALYVLSFYFQATEIPQNWVLSFCSLLIESGIEGMPYDSHILNSLHSTGWLAGQRVGNCVYSCMFVCSFMYYDIMKHVSAPNTNSLPYFIYI